VKHAGTAVLILGFAIMAGIAAYGLRAGSGPTTPTQAGPDPYEQLGEPDYLPPEVSSDALRPAVDRRLKEGVRLKAIKAIEGNADLTWQDLAALYRVLGDRRDSDTIRHEAAQLLRDRRDPGLAEALLKVLADPEEGERFRFFATQHLGELFQRALTAGDERARELRADLRHLLADDRHVLVRRQALLSLGKAWDPVTKEAMVAALEAPGDGPLVDTAMRLAVIHRDEALYPHLRRRAWAEDLFVRRRAVACLGELKDAASRPAFEAAAAAKDEALAEAGRLALSRLDGTKEQP